MPKPISILSAIFLLISTAAIAQTDSTQYDLGRVSLKKEFTQGITIKGTDLEHFQFSNLADAIKVWFYGSYSNPSTLLYVIDGNIITDVNAYSIFDIDEITLIQNALAPAIGANADQQLVLIKLKTNRTGKKGIEVNGQTSFVNLKSPPNGYLATSTTSLYNRYYISTFKNYKSVSLGVSAEYQRDVFPGVIVPYPNKNIFSSNITYHFDSFSPSNFNRIKLNTYLKADLGKSNSLYLRTNYTPQSYNGASNYDVHQQGDNFLSKYSNTPKLDQNIINLYLSLTSKVLNGLNNSLSISYNNFNISKDSTSTFQDYLNNLLKFNSVGSYKFNEAASIFLLKDNLSYQKKWGGIGIIANLNFSFRKVKDSIDYNTTIKEPLFGEAYTSISTGSTMVDYKLYFITPSLNLFYKSIVNLQAGFIDILNSDNSFLTNDKVDHIFPFVSTSFNIGNLIGPHFNHFSIFGSFSRKSKLLADGYGYLTDFSILNNFNLINSSQLGNTNGYLDLFYSNTLNTYGSYNSFQTGAIIDLTKNLILNYSFEYRYYKALGQYYPYFQVFDFSTYPYFYDDKIISNRIGLNYAMKLNNLNWKVGLNASESRIQLAQYGGYSYIKSTDNVTYIDKYFLTNLGAGYRWSGGITNRIDCKSFFAGMDILYQIGERPYTIYNLSLSNIATDNSIPLNNKSFSLQNLFFGKQLKISKLNYTEIYLNGRNILQNKSSSITDNRRYFGAGFKVAL